MNNMQTCKIERNTQKLFYLNNSAQNTRTIFWQNIKDENTFIRIMFKSVVCLNLS